MVSGDYDLGDILAGATFSAASAGLTSGIDFGFPKDHPFHDALFGIGSGQFTMAGLLETGLDGVIRSGLSSAVYGTDFGDGVLASVVSYVANGVSGALIEETANVFGHGAFSIEKLVAKATINCLAAEAGGASCASGAIGSLVTELVIASGSNLGADDIQTYRQRLQVIGAIAGYFTSGGEADNVYATAFAALNDYDNNVLPFLAVLAVLGGGLTVTDYALTAYDAYDLAQDGLACDAGDQAACDRTLEKAKQYAIETGITLPVGQIIPGDKIGMKLIAALRKNGDDEIIDAVNRAENASSGTTIHIDNKGNALIGDWSTTKRLTSPENALGIARQSG